MRIKYQVKFEIYQDDHPVGYPPETFKHESEVCSSDLEGTNQTMDYLLYHAIEATIRMLVIKAAARSNSFLKLNNNVTS